MGAYKLKSKSLKINNTNYYRSNGVQLGDVGDMKNPIFSVNRVDSQSNIPAPKQGEVWRSYFYDIRVC